MSQFVHLHTHSDYSLLDGAASIGKLVKKAVEHQMPALALTDHGNLFGALKFYKECQKQGIKPLIGSEFYLAPGSCEDKAGVEKEARYYHLVLLAKSITGYKNLLKLSSLGFTKGFYYKPRIDKGLLAQYSEDLVGLSACLAGEIPAHILNGKPKEAAKAAGFYREVLGAENFFLELQDHGLPEQRLVNKEVAALAKQLDIPLVATNDIHYPGREDAYAQDVLICIGTNKKITDGDRLRFEHPEFYFKSGDEMALLFAGYPEALENTLRVAEMCNVQIPLPGPILPDYQVPAGFTIESYLAHLAKEGLKTRYTPVTEEIAARLDYELKTIISMGFAGYFLIVWDFIHYARKNNIPVGPGRGSGAGSLVAYALHITDIDPLKYSLLFERFLNPERVSMPDFDIDFCIEGRGQVIEYVTEKYGKDKVGQIITFGTLGAKAAIRDVARVLDYPYAEADAIAKLVPTGPKVTLVTALDQEPKLKELVEQNEKNKALLDTSLKLEGLSRHASTHAAGVVIGKEELTHYVPLYRDPKTGSISTQFTMDYLEECGLVKMDFLGLKNLTLIDRTCEMIRKKGLDFDITRIPDNDPATFKLLGEGKSTCVFQFESSGMQAILKRAKPDKIEDLIALNALYRPGPMENIDQYIESKLGKRKITYPLPELEPILKETYGVIIYQEQVMQIARQVAGFSLGQADILRRAMGKKKADVMEKQKELFVKGAAAKGYTKETATSIFDLLVPFAGYGFNKSHAAAYSVLAYQTAYLKANYAAEFMAAYLSLEINDTDKLAQYIAEARSMGIEILPPNINLSEDNFTVVEGKIVYGLLGIKNVGTTAVNNIIAERTANGPYKNIHDFLERVDLKTANHKVLEALILSGVFDLFGERRSTFFHNLDALMENAQKNKERKAFGQMSLFDMPQMEALTQVQLERVEEWPQLELLRMEKQNLGFYFSGHPLDRYKELIKNKTSLNLARLEEAVLEQTYLLVGIFKDKKEIITKKGKKMAFGALEDYRGTIELVIFSDAYEKYNSLLVNDKVIVVTGKLDKGKSENFNFLVNEVSEPEGVSKKEARIVHIRLIENIDDEDALYNLRDFVFQQAGKCMLYLHLPDLADKTQEKVIRASAAISVSDDDVVLESLRQHPYVKEVWKE